MERISASSEPHANSHSMRESGTTTTSTKRMKLEDRVAAKLERKRRRLSKHYAASAKVRVQIVARSDPNLSSRNPTSSNAHIFLLVLVSSASFAFLFFESTFYISLF